MGAHDRAENVERRRGSAARGPTLTGASRCPSACTLLAGAGDFRAVLDRVGAGAALGELVAHHAGDDVLAGLQAEDVVLERSREPTAAPSKEVMSIFTAQASEEGVSAGAEAWVSAPRSSSVMRNLPGFGASAGRAFFTASRMKIELLV